MRAFCTVSAPLEVCAPPTPLLPGSRFLALRLLGTPQPRTLYFLVEAKSRVREVYAQTCLHFSKQGMLDTELFGLAVLIDGEYLFADPESKLSKYGPKSWRSSHTHGLDANGRPLLELHFRVQFYIESPLMLRDETSRHNYYLQLKTNAITRELPKDCTEQSLLLLSGLSLQADIGDSPEDVSDYFRIEDYVQSGMLTNAWCTNALKLCHREYRGMRCPDAETQYIREACALPEILNAHVFRMKETKNEMGSGSILFVVYAKGIKIAGENFPLTKFAWGNITKLTFERKKFEIRSGDDKITLYSNSDEKNKALLALCKETHQFAMKNATRLNEAIRREEEESSGLHASYMYSRSLHLPYKNKADQRISVISSTSSNTTSGIVSDRVHSEDELEIIINSPPVVPIAAPSTESLALAHLLDGQASISRQTSSAGRNSLKGIDDTMASISLQTTHSIGTDSTEPIDQSNSTDSPRSQHNIGSQSSSTCSTVVVATDSLPTLSSHVSSMRRNPSTSSSLELGFSHTAQNSAISDATNGSIEFGANDDENLSGMYTLAHQAPTETSGVYTMSNSELTGQSSELAESESHESSYYGSFQPKSDIMDTRMENLDSVDGKYRKRMGGGCDSPTFRLRSDSNMSSGSFRGDGSDPTDGKHVLLSAEELTDLIVGRGTYPTRKTVSNTLDSDCDYVTLPMPLEGDSYLQGHEDTAPTEEIFEEDLLPSNPPIPPVRIDSNTPRTRPSASLPPPYNARHEKTGLCGPPAIDEVPAIPLRDPPPYPQPVRTAPTPEPPKIKFPEEAAARFIKTRPQINILKAHTSVVNENPKPSFAAPTKSQISATHLSIPSTIGIPIVPYAMPHKSMSSNVVNLPPPYPTDLSQKPPPRTCVLLPVHRQYVPPPPSQPRQPPPPPPPQLATVYTSQLARSQIELYQQQLYSDVDYVIYPLRDPAVSQQEYLDAKQGSILAAMAQSPPPQPYLAYHTGSHHGTWDTSWKGHAIYRSTPYLPLAYSTHSRYASTQNLSDTYVQLPGTYSPMYSPSVASLCSSYEPPPPPPLRPRPIATATMFSRSKSDDNILNLFEAVPRVRRLPPPPPPPYDKKPNKPPIPVPHHDRPSLTSSASHINQTAPSKALPYPPCQPLNRVTTIPISPRQATYPLNDPSNNGAQPNTNIPSGSNTPDQTIDINTLREKSKHLDLPLIAALCNDRSLLKQTNAFVLPQHPRLAAMITGSIAKGKYPVSGLSPQQLNKPRKSSISHRHPNDKLPPLPVQTAEANNYVMDPTPIAIKHKSFNSQPST